MVKNALPHFSLTRKRARKNQTPISDHTPKALAMATWDQEVPGEMPSVCGSSRDAVRCERRATADAFAEIEQRERRHA